MSGTVKLEMNDVGRILRDKGLDGGGQLQRFHTNNVMERIIKYMPLDSSVLTKSVTIQNPLLATEIKVEQPYAKFQFYGMLMVGITSGSAYAKPKEPKRATDIPLTYSHHKHPLAGPRWDKALSAAEGPAMVADLQRRINRR